MRYSIIKNLNVGFGASVAATIFLLCSVSTAFAGCPAATVADMKGVKAGKYPQQFELKEFERLASCSLSFKDNPDIAKLNSKIRGNPSNISSVEKRIPEEPLVYAPYHSIGKYGGTLDVLSNATEAGTSDFLSVRHVNLVRFSDDLQTIVPNIAKDWKWNSDFTKLTFYLRKGHKWSDGKPFTAEDVKFWYDHLALSPLIMEKPKDYVLVNGKPMNVEVVDPQTVVFNLPAPKPGLLAHFANSFAQGFQPKHFLAPYHPELNPNADKEAQKAGFENGLAVIKAYFGNSDWTDTPSPLLNSPDKVSKLPADVIPTLESHIYVTDTTEGRHLVANPYFHIVDTQGNQLPYISEQDEVYINDREIRLLKLINGEVHYKAQSLQLPAAPLLLENKEKGGYQVDLRPEIGLANVSFNVTHPNLVKRQVYADLRFRKAMSVAINREEINEVAFFGLGQPKQFIGFTPRPDFVNEKWESYMIQYDPDMSNSLLDEIGMVDRDGDGYRELPNGEKIVINMQFATQGVAGQVVEMVGQNWDEVGVKTTVKEVTPDEYRSAQSANQLDIGFWRSSQPLAIVLGNNELWIPPFENYFGHRTGMLWAEYLDSDGAKGVKPPDYVYEMISDINEFQTTPIGTPRFKELGERLVKNHTTNLIKIGIALSPAPIYHRNVLKNFVEFQTHSYEYYRTYPYRGTQWYLDE